MAIARAPGCPVRAATCKNAVEYVSVDTRLRGVFGYDAAGQITSYCETATDGSVRFDLVRSYDERGRRVRQVEDVANLGPEHRVATWEYDDADRLRRITVDFDGDVRVTERQYADDGRLARQITTRDDEPPDVVTYVYRDGEPLVIDELHDAWGWRYTFAAGRWLSRIENLGADGTARTTEWLTYVDRDRGRLARRDLDTDGDGVSDDITTYTWRDDRVATATYDHAGDGEVDQLDRYAYDRGGRMIERTWSSPRDGFASATTFSWHGGNVERAVRRDVTTGDAIESWTFYRGCEGERPMTLLLAPTSDWARSLDPVGVTVDLRRFWGFHEVI
jgi:hypothetical protein